MEVKFKKIDIQRIKNYIDFMKSFKWFETYSKGTINRVEKNFEELVQ